MSYFEDLMARTVERLRAATVAHDALVAKVFPEGPHSDPSVIDRVWHDLKAARPEFRAVEDEAIDALYDLYDPHEDLSQVREAIQAAGADWIEHTIFNRAV